MSLAKPALSLAAVPGRRQRTLELAREIEQRGYAGIYCPSLGDGLALSQGIAHVTTRIPFGTSVQPIYYRQVEDYAQTIAFINEIAPGRFSFGIGVAHAPSLANRGLSGGKPLADMEDFVARLRAAPRAGELPKLVLATLRRKMIALAARIADGMVFANAARSHMAFSLAALPPGRAADDDFYIGNMIPTCVNDSLDAARAINRRTLASYALLPNYRNYWREAGYGSEMDAVERCIADNRLDQVGHALSDQWLDDTTIAGPPSRVREELQRWYEAGVKTPILVPSAVKGGQMQAFEELFAVFD
ncbi:MAG: LLM class flavin-dependent oxidoreductase [Proteobacteria bacterium]|nr:LLM class flavin-dependent oxidoreductase [Pseudomonadota bacterium]